MTKSTKAALLSGLVFPGTGHLILNQFLRGLTLLLVALVAMSVLVVTAVKQALAVLDRVNSGEITVEPGAIAEIASMPVSGAGDSIMNIASLVFVTVWIIGIVDSYRLGASQEK